MEPTRNYRKFNRICEEISNWYENTDDPIFTKSHKQKIQSWIQWFEDTYPTMDPTAVLEGNMDTADFRVFFLAYPIPGFALVRVLDAYHSIDKALCGTSTSALERVKRWWNMDQFKYLSSDDHRIWWEAALCELNDAIEDGDTGNLRVTLQFNRVIDGARRLNILLDDMDNHFRMYLRDESEMPEDYEEINSSIEDNAALMATSAEALTKSFEQAKLRGGTREQMENTKDSGANFRNQDITNEG